MAHLGAPLPNSFLIILDDLIRALHEIGLWIALAKLMERSTHPCFLKLIALLCPAARQVDTQNGILPEMRSMAEKVMWNVLGKNQKTADA